MPNEAEFLDLQAQRAKERLRRRAQTLTEDLLGPLQIRPFIQRRPWWSLGGAAVAGFLSGLGLGGRGWRVAARSPGAKAPWLSIGKRRLWRVLRKVLGAIVMTNLRAGEPTGGATKSNGHPARPPAGVS